MDDNDEDYDLDLLGWRALLARLNLVHLLIDPAWIYVTKNKFDLTLGKDGEPVSALALLLNRRDGRAISRVLGRTVAVAVVEKEEDLAKVCEDLFLKTVLYVRRPEMRYHFANAELGFDIAFDTPKTAKVKPVTVLRKVLKPVPRPKGQIILKKVPKPQMNSLRPVPRPEMRLSMRSRVRKMSKELEEVVKTKRPLYEAMDILNERDRRQPRKTSTLVDESSVEQSAKSPPEVGLFCDDEKVVEEKSETVREMKLEPEESGLFEHDAEDSHEPEGMDIFKTGKKASIAPHSLIL